MIITKGVNINSSDNRGRTPLMYAAEYGYYDIIQLLAKKGANIKARDNEDKTALFLAQDGQHTGAALLLEKLIKKGEY